MLRQSSDSRASLCEDAIKQFEIDWLSGKQPNINDYLSASAESKERLLLELVHIDLEFRYRLNQTPQVEEYLQRFPLLANDPDEIINLIAAEYSHRHRYGQNAKEDDFLARFPQYRNKLEGKFAAQASTLSWPRRQPLTVPTEFPQIPGHQIEELTGHGGMGVVYRATQPSLHRAVAVKSLIYGVAATTEVKDRFRHEAEAIARLDHPHIVPVYEVGEWKPDGAATTVPFFVMKFYPGGSLASEPAGPGTDLHSHVKTVETIAHAVHHAHQRGILHRDLKPSNILLDENGQPHVVDFGLAGRFDPNDPQSMTATIMGTPAYMAPEQARSPSQVTTAADVYGLGAILYQLLTGQPPFRAETPLAVLELVAHQPPQRPSKWNPQVPRDLETICMKCLHKEPSLRYDSPAALALDLQRFRTGQSILARPLPTHERAWRTIRRHPVISSLLLLTFATLVTSVVVLADSNARIREQEFETRNALQREKWTHAELISTFNREQQLLYGKRIFTVGRLWATNQLPQAWAELDACPERFRGWEWRYYNSLRTKEPITFQSPEQVMRTIGFLSNSQLVTSDAKGYVTIWDIASQKTLTSWKANAQAARAIAIFSKNKWLAVSDADSTTVWNYETQKKLSTLPGCIWVAFSPNGEYLAASHSISSTKDTHDSIVWETAYWQQKWLLKGHTAVVLNGTFSPDNQTLITTSSDRTVRRWNLTDGQPLGEPRKRSLPTFRIASLPDGRHLAEAQPSAMVWTDTTSGKELGRYNWSQITQPQVLTGRVQVATGPDPSIIAFSGPSHDIQVWDIQRNRSLAVFRGHNLHIGALEFSPDGKRLASASNDMTFRIWELGQQREYQSFGELNQLVTDMTLSPDGQWLAVIPHFHAQQPGSDQIYILSTRDGSELARFPGVGAASFTSDGHLFTGQADGGVTCWNLQTQAKVWIHKSSPQRISSLGLSPDGKTVIAVEINGMVKRLDRLTGNLVEEIPVEGRFLRAASLSPLANEMAFVSQHEVELWNLETKTKKHGFPMNGTRKLTFSSDGQIVACAEADRVIRLRSAKTGALLATFPGHPRSINSFAFNANGTRLVSSCSDGLIRIWDVETAQELTTLPGQFEESILATWDHHNDQIIAVDTKVHVWQTTPKHAGRSN